MYAYKNNANRYGNGYGKWLRMGDGFREPEGNTVIGGSELNNVVLNNKGPERRGGGKGTNGSKKIDFCRKAVDIILKSPLDQLKNLTVESITQELAISKVYLGQCFKAGGKETPGKFLSRQKMLRAQSLLMNNRDHLTVREISELLGYASTDYFIRKFNKFFGRPPCQYRILKTQQVEQDSKPGGEGE